MFRHLPKHFFSSASSSFYDIIISGAGPAGASLACALSQSPLFSSTTPSILLLDHMKPDSIDSLKVEGSMKNVIGDHRVVTLTPGSMRFINSLNLSSHLEQKRITPVRRMQVWESTSDGYFIIDSEKNGEKENLAYTIEIKHIQAALMEKIKELGRVKLGIPDSIEEIDYSNEKEVRVKLKQGGWVGGKLVVGSDGKNSKVKQAANIPTYGWPYHQMGIVCTIQADSHLIATAFQRYLPNGLIALLPLWEDYYSIVWTVNVEEFDYLSKLDDAGFIKELNKVLTISSSKPSLFPPVPGIVVDAFNSIANGALKIVDTVLGKKGEMIENQSSVNPTFTYPPFVIKNCNKRLSFPLNQLQSKRYIGKRTALVGDAAHNIHPMAGQGLNMGLGDVMFLSNCILKNLKAGMEIGSQENLQEFETQAKLMNYTMAMTMEGLGLVYGRKGGIWSEGRGLGMNFVNGVEAVKKGVREMAEGEVFLPKRFEWE